MAVLVDQVHLADAREGRVGRRGGAAEDRAAGGHVDDRRGRVGPADERQHPLLGGDDLLQVGHRAEAPRRASGQRAVDQLGHPVDVAGEPQPVVVDGDGAAGQLPDGKVRVVGLGADRPRGGGPARPAPRVPPAVRVRHEQQGAVRGPQRVLHGDAGGRVGAGAVDEHPLLDQVRPVVVEAGDDELGPVPGHGRLVPLHPGADAVGAHGRVGVEVVPGGEHGSRVGRAAGPGQGDEARDDVLRVGVVLAHRQDDAERGARRGGRVAHQGIGRSERHRPAALERADHLLGRGVDPDDDAVAGGPGAASVLVDARPHVGRGWGQLDDGVAGPAQQRHAGTLLGARLEPEGVPAVAAELAHRDPGGQHVVQTDGGVPRSMGGGDHRVGGRRTHASRVRAPVGGSPPSGRDVPMRRRRARTNFLVSREHLA